MVRRLLSLILVIWALGFVGFAITLPQPAGDEKSDAVVVLTGGEGRIARGLEMLGQGRAPVLLVSGVDPEVKPHEFAVEYKVSAAQMGCCVVLGYDSVDTRSNARETAAFVASRHLRSIRLVTSDWHMRRAYWEMRRALPGSVIIVQDGVLTHPSLGILFAEYSKFLARLIWHLGAQ
jgi:uncharacterized SAM-binding protein YcdF (DUF218 family)